MHKKALITALALVISTPIQASSERTLEERIAALEAALENALAEAKRAKASEAAIMEKYMVQESKSKDNESYDDSIEVFGSLAIDVKSIADDTPSKATSDIIINRLELGATKNLSEETSVTGSILYAEDDTDLEIDILKLSHTFKGTPLTVSIGQDYLPFGNYNSELTSDLFTYQLGLIRETSLVANYKSNGFDAYAYAFNGKQDHNSVNSIANYGWRLAYSNDYLTIGKDYITNIADTNKLESKDFGYSAGEDTVAGSSIFAQLSLGNFKASFEHLKALDELAVDANNSKPEAKQVELSYRLGNYTLGIANQTTLEALFLDLPKERKSIVINRAIEDYLNIGLEWSKDQDYSVKEGGSDKKSDSVTLQVKSQF